MERILEIVQQMETDIEHRGANLEELDPDWLLEKLKSIANIAFDSDETILKSESTKL